MEAEIIQLPSARRRSRYYSVLAVGLVMVAAAAVMFAVVVMDSLGWLPYINIWWGLPLAALIMFVRLALVFVGGLPDAINEYVWRLLLWGFVASVIMQTAPHEVYAMAFGQSLLIVGALLLVGLRVRIDLTPYCRPWTAVVAKGAMGLFVVAAAFCAASPSGTYVKPVCSLILMVLCASALVVGGTIARCYDRSPAKVLYCARLTAPIFGMVPALLALLLR